MNSQGGHRLPRSQENHGRRPERCIQTHLCCPGHCPLPRKVSRAGHTGQASYPMSPVYSLHPEQAALLEHKEPMPSSVRKRELILPGLQSEGGEKRPWLGAQGDQGQARHRHKRGTWRGSERGHVDTGSRHLRPSTGPMAGGHWGGEEMGRKAATKPPPTLSQLSWQNTAESARQPSVLLDRPLPHSQAPPFRTRRPSHGVLRANSGWGRRITI